ncbi:hypothetical protein V6S67_08635 [Arthrobacter sp. Soc17.1.1.1]|uniref:hypothetical protein n=1 Tax=Arthrobacter sp. Soc17.1.1.1 TaxID=3121277 RepID=UPI002FE4A7D5
MSKDLKLPYLLIAITFAVAGSSGRAGGQPGMLTSLILAGGSVGLGLSADKNAKRSLNEQQVPDCLVG